MLRLFGAATGARPVFGGAGLLVGGFPLGEFFLGDAEQTIHRALKTLRGFWPFALGAFRGLAVSGHAGTPCRQCSRPGRLHPWFPPAMPTHEDAPGALGSGDGFLPGELVERDALAGDSLQGAGETIRV